MAETEKDFEIEECLGCGTAIPLTTVSECKLCGTFCCDHCGHSSGDCAECGGPTEPIGIVRG